VSGQVLSQLSGDIILRRLNDLFTVQTIHRLRVVDQEYGSLATLISLFTARDYS